MFILATPRANMPWACDDMSPFRQSFVTPRRGQIVHSTNNAGAKGPAESITSVWHTSSFRPTVAAPQTSWESDHGSFPFLCFLCADGIHPDQSPEDNIPSGTI